MDDAATDILYLGKNKLPFDAPRGIKLLFDYDVWKKLNDMVEGFPLLNISQYLNEKDLSPTLNFLSVGLNSLSTELIDKIKKDDKTVIILETSNDHGMAEQRRLFFEFIEQKINNPVIIKRNYIHITYDEFRLYASTDFGALLIDGLGDGVWVGNSEINSSKGISSDSYIKRLTLAEESYKKFINRTLFGILQAARVRISKTEYIACPSCGRTLFDLQETTEFIRRRTEHLKGVKIAVMGCIVNGPGEMADADYGYVGSGVDKITLYRAREIVKRNIPTSGAVDALIELIKEDGIWIKPSQGF